MVAVVGNSDQRVEPSYLTGLVLAASKALASLKVPTRTELSAKEMRQARLYAIKEAQNSGRPYHSPEHLERFFTLLTRMEEFIPGLVGQADVLTVYFHDFDYRKGSTGKIPEDFAVLAFQEYASREGFPKALVDGVVERIQYTVFPVEVGKERGWLNGDYTKEWLGPIDRLAGLAQFIECNREEMIEGAIYESRKVLLEIKGNIDSSEELLRFALCFYDSEVIRSDVKALRDLFQFHRSEKGEKFVDKLSNAIDTVVVAIKGQLAKDAVFPYPSPQSIAA
jgi:hypothetical protein